MTWDGIPVAGVSVDDLSAESFEIFKNQAIKSKRIDSSEDLGPKGLQLENLNLFVNNHLTRAAVLLFHHNPEKWIPGAYVKIGYFENDAEVSFQDEIHGSLLSQIDRVIDLLYTKYLKGNISYDDITRVTTYPYPRNAIRELVLNAIAHKNYALMIPIQIKVYPDHMVISNDCVFPQGWTVETLLKPHRSRPYNPLIANALFRAGFIESWGRGIEKIRNSCIENGSKFPEFDLSDGDITISIGAICTDPLSKSNRHPVEIQSDGKTENADNETSLKQVLKQVLKQANYEKLLPIVSYVERVGEISVQEAVDLTGKSRTTAWRYLRMLVDADVAEAIGETNNSTYVLKEKYMKGDHLNEAT